MTSKVSGMAEFTGDARFISPVQVLESSINELQQGQSDFGQSKHMLVIGLNPADGAFNVSYRNAGLSCSQMLAMIEVMKVMILKDMVLIPEGQC